MYFTLLSLSAIAALAAALPTSPQAREEDIVGGQPANSGDFPFAAYLENRSNGGACTATLISPTKLLCAAHCFGSDDPPFRYDVRVGSLDRTTGGQRIPLSDVRIHPQYNPRNYNYDAAVLTLSSPAPAGIAFAQLPPRNFVSTIGELVQLAGWGRFFSDGPTPTRLEKVQVQTLNNSICQQAYGFPGFDPAINLCFGEPEGGRGSCQGDSGGPAIINNKTIIGITSYGGAVCASSQSQSVYARVNAFEDFIRANL